MFNINTNFNYKKFMKKLSLLFAFSIAFILCVNAQENRSYYVQQNQNQSSKDNKEDDDDGRENFFIGGGIRGDVYINDDAAHHINVWSMPTLDAELFVGKWINSKIGARVFFEGGALHPFFQKEKQMEHEKYFSARADFMLDVTSFRSYSRDRFYGLVPYVGLGIAHAFDAKNRPDNEKNYTSFMFGGGLMNTFRLSDNFSAYFNVGLDIVKARFDGWSDKNKRFNGIFAPSIGVVYNFD